MTCLVHIIKLALVFCIYSVYVNARYLILDRGKLGKKFWGENHTVMEGHNITLQCGSQVKRDLPKFTGFYWYWLFQNRKLGNKKLPEEALMALPFVGVNVKRYRPSGFVAWPEHIPDKDIKLVKVNRYSTGEYACAVATTFGSRPNQTTYSEITLQNVVVQCKPRIESKKETEIQLNAGDKMTLDCMSSGFPKPVIKWRRVDGRPLTFGYITHSDGVLSLKNVGQLDIGKYQCISLNRYGNDTRIFTVDIKVRPAFMGTTTSYSMDGQEGMVRCVAVGMPRPAFSWKWRENGYDQTLSTHDGLMGRFKVKTEHYFENSTSYLIIKNVQSVDFRDYQCLLKDSSGSTIDERMQLHKAYSVPDAPTIQTETVSTGSTSITLVCQLGKSNGGKPVTSVIVEILLQNNTELEWRRETIPDVQNSVRYTISGLQSSTEYRLRAIAVNGMGESKPSAEYYARTKLKVSEELLPSRNPIPVYKNGNKDKESVDMMVLLAGVAGGFLVLIIAIVIVCILMRNMQRNNAKKVAENAERLAKSANDDTTTALINFLHHGGERFSTPPGSGGGDILHLTTSNKWEFPRERLVLQNVLGSGAFGIVMKAEAEGINGYNSGTTPVAVKFVKENESASAKKDLIAELELLKLIEPHKNVINLLGCCTRSEPLMVIVEFCAYGDLQSFLRASRGIRDQYYLDCYKRPSSRLTSKELLMFGTQISRGMAHLACLKVIHRDLAARNILVDENKVCKVSDFGFARDIYVEDHYTRKTAGGRFPIKWMAIESLLDGISTTKSDVWSFAIVLWEIITLGASPYPGMNSQEVVSFLQNGMRMDKPKHCSDELYNLLLDCWQVASHRRPNFEMLARYLDRMCNDDFEYINMRTYDDHLYINFDGNTVSEGSKSGSLLKQEIGSKDISEESTGDKESN